MQLTWMDKVRCDKPGPWLLTFWHIKKWHDLYLLFLLGANLKRVRQSAYKEHSFETISDLVTGSGFQFYLLWYIPCLSLHSLSYGPPQKRIRHSTKQWSWKMEINTWFLTLHNWPLHVYLRKIVSRGKIKIKYNNFCWRVYFHVFYMKSPTKMQYSQFCW